MPPLPIISGDDLVKALRWIGYNWERTSGSHMILVHESRNTLSVPPHREIGRGLLRRLIRDAGIITDELVRLLA
jgi:predicted RNA binding protein YcfA (HicA-like mRNA interferase family)